MWFQRAELLFFLNTIFLLVDLVKNHTFTSVWHHVYHDTTILWGIVVVSVRGGQVLVPVCSKGNKRITLVRHGTVVTIRTAAGHAGLRFTLTVFFVHTNTTTHLNITHNMLFAVYRTEEQQRSPICSHEDCTIIIIITRTQ